jgi:TrmH family RNA methyltransferase
MEDTRMPVVVEATWQRLNHEAITSRANPTVRQIRALQQRKERDRQRLFPVEGILPVWRAVDSHAPIETLIVAPDLLTSVAAREMVVRQIEHGMRVVSVSGAVFEQVAERENPSGLAAIVTQFDAELSQFATRSTAVLAAFHTPSNPGNLGTSLRTIDATGCDGAIVIGGTDIYSPTCVKASMGTLFSVPFARAQDWDTVEAWCRERQVVTVATSSTAELDLWSTRLPERSVLVFGNEGEGLPPSVAASCDMSVKIPMAHGGSLNLAVAVAVVLFEYRRQHAPH